MLKKRAQQPLKKQPTQARAQQTLAKIHTATIELLAEDGYDNLTTNRIAARAKVNIASLYQYYDNKDAIVEDLAMREFKAITKSLSEKAIEVSNLRFEEALRQGLMHVVELYRNSESLFVHIIDSAQEIYLSKASLEFKKTIFTVGKSILKSENSSLKKEQYECALYVCYNSLAFVMADHLRGLDPGRFSDQQIIDELTRMVCGHLGITD